MTSDDSTLESLGLGRAPSGRIGREPTEPMGPLIFDTVPELSEFFTRGGVPGVEYLHAMAKNMVKFQQVGWEMLKPAVSYAILCDGEQVPMVVLGHGEPIKGASPYSSIPRTFLDKEAQTLFKLPEKGATDGEAAQEGSKAASEPEG